MADKISLLFYVKHLEIFLEVSSISFAKEQMFLGLILKSGEILYLFISEICFPLHDLQMFKFMMNSPLCFIMSSWVRDIPKRAKLNYCLILGPNFGNAPIHNTKLESNFPTLKKSLCLLKKIYKKEKTF
jgi:hypothetical protein